MKQIVISTIALLWMALAHCQGSYFLPLNSLSSEEQKTLTADSTTVRTVVINGVVYIVVYSQT
jgi:hypothetical protein